MTDNLHEHGCDCGCEEVYELEIMHLTFADDNGEEFEVEAGILDIFMFEDKQYIALALPETEDEEASFIIYGYAEDEEENPVLDVLEDEELQRVIDYFEDEYFEE
ncbi:MAG: DUF1292 domain-containing protein [Tissierellia bacterium]|nr:DUF1292 domain-containing protein [Tissierellia bacterium]